MSIRSAFESVVSDWVSTVEPVGASESEKQRVRFNKQMSKVLVPDDVQNLLLNTYDGIALDDYWRRRLEIPQRYLGKWLRKYNQNQWMDRFIAFCRSFPKIIRLHLFVELVTFPTTPQSPSFKPNISQVVRFLDSIPAEGIPFAGAILEAYDKVGINDLITVRRGDQMTALMVCAMLGESRSLQTLLDQGADPNRRNEKQVTALYVAILYGQPGCAKLLFGVSVLDPPTLWAVFDRVVTRGIMKRGHNDAEKVLHMLECWWNNSPQAVFDVAKALNVAIACLHSMETWFKRLQASPACRTPLKQSQAVEAAWDALTRLKRQWNRRGVKEQVQTFMELLIRASSSPPGLVRMTVTDHALDFKYETKKATKRNALGAFLQAGSFASVFVCNEDQSECIRLTHQRMDPQHLNLERRGNETLMKLQAYHHPGIMELKEWGMYEFEGSTSAFCSMTQQLHSKQLCTHNTPTQNGIYSVQTLYNGGDLWEFLNGKESVSDDSMVIGTMQLVSALKVVADAGFLHCDVKPENVCLNSTIKHLVLIDFGLACPLNSIVTAGSMDYFTPEQYHNQNKFGIGKRCTASMDLYCLGLTMLVAFLELRGHHKNADTILNAKYRNSSPNWDRSIAAQFQDSQFVQILCDMLIFTPSSRPSHDQLLQNLSRLLSTTDQRRVIVRSDSLNHHTGTDAQESLARD